MKKAYSMAIKAVFTAFYKFKRTTKQTQYLALIAGFMVFAPFSQSFISEAVSAFTIDNQTYTPINKGTTTLVARTDIPAYHYKKVERSKIYERVLTAYSSTPEETDGTPFITASGSYVRFGVIAANWLPIGTAVRIPEYFGKQIFIVEDRMNKRHSEKVDVWLPTREAALNFGKRLTKIEVL